ncbi:MAG: phage holin family protein [Desulforhopalus sp.]
MNNSVVHKASASKRESMKELLTNLASNFTSVVRGEFALAAQSLREMINVIRNGIILIAIGLFIGFVAFISLCATVVLKLMEFMSAVGATLTVGGVLGVISVLLALIGFKKIKSSVQ